MAIKAGQILHDANGFVIDRIQTAGVGNVNIPEEKVYELGNYKTVATVRDIPDLSFDMESFDMSTETEAVLLNLDPSSLVDGDEIDFNKAVPVDIVSPYKDQGGSFDIVKGIATPYLNLERVTYRFGLRQNATQSFTLRGDGIYYIPGTPYYQEYVNTGTGAYNFTNTAIEYEETGKSVYALSVVLRDSNSAKYKRLFLGDHYTNTSAGFVLLQDYSTDYDTVCAVYGSLTPATYPQSVHEDVSVKPAAVRGRTIDVYLSDGAATPTWTRWTSVQSVEATRSVNIENDEEFGNSRFVASDYDTADVTGSIGVKPVDSTDLFEKIAQVTNVATNKIAGALSSTPIEVEIRIGNPDDINDIQKTLYIPDARFTPPGVQGRVQTKLETTFNFTSDSGTLLVYKGARS